MKPMFLAVAAVLALSVSAQAADLSSSDLAQYGLSGMHTMSDAQGMQIRAQGLSIKTGAIQVNVVTGSPAPYVNFQQNAICGSNSVKINLSVKVSLGGRSPKPI